ncbi:MAG: alcohol dehydrogenase catalytic domain-containing protein [Xanthobacteraceae bacterium]
MAKLRRQSLTEYGAPLCETVVNLPEPRGTEVLVRIGRCGVCHSDLHMQDGYFLLGDDKKLDVRGGRTLPFTLGHEITGMIESAGPEAAQALEREGGAASSLDAGRTVAVYPWIGCGKCAACARGEENICAAPRYLGIQVDGGYASHVLLPHPRYLIDYAPLPASLAAALMCSGLTAYAAFRRFAAYPEHVKHGPVLLVGMGGVGMMGLAIACRMFPHAPIVADIDPNKREVALASGAQAAFDPADAGARKAIMARTGGGVLAAVDFVGSDRSLTFATGAIAKGGRVVVTGLFGGTFTMPVAMFGLKAMGIEGTQTGTLAEAREVVALARSWKLSPPPMSERPLADAQAVLDDLRAGRVVGRVVLTT